MEDKNPQEIMAQLDAELAQMKREHPEEYLDLLKTLNHEIEEIIKDFGAA